MATFNYVPGSLDIQGITGDDFSLLFDFNIDLTGYTFQGRILLDNVPTGRFVDFTITDTNLPLGRITLSLNDTQTKNIGPISGRKWFLVWTTGVNSRTVISGNFALNPRWGSGSYSPTTDPVTVTVEQDTIEVSVIGGAGGAIVWGDIVGDIQDQEDLIQYLEGNYVTFDGVETLSNKTMLGTFTAQMTETETGAMMVNTLHNHKIWIGGTENTLTDYPNNDHTWTRMVIGLNCYENPITGDVSFIDPALSYSRLQMENNWIDGDGNVLNEIYYTSVNTRVMGISNRPEIPDSSDMFIKGTFSVEPGPDAEAAFDPNWNAQTIRQTIAGSAKLLRLHNLSTSGSSSVRFRMERGNINTDAVDFLHDASRFQIIHSKSGRSAFQTNLAGNVYGGPYNTEATAPHDFYGNALLRNNITITGIITAGSGPTTLTDSVGKILSAALNTVAAAQGGTGQSSYTVGDLLYASATNALSKLAAVASGNVLLSAGTGTAPVWGKVTLSQTTGIAASGQNTDITSLNLPSTTSTLGQILINSIRAIHFYGTENSFIGIGAGNFTLTGTQNTVVGSGGAPALTTGTGNTVFGAGALPVNLVGNNNTAIGLNALNSATSNDNVGVGRAAGYSITSGFRNTIVGVSSAGGTLTTGSTVTLVGYNADVNAGNLTNATAIGASAVADASNAVVLGNSSVTRGGMKSTKSGVLWYVPGVMESTGDIVISTSSSGIRYLSSTGVADLSGSGSPEGAIAAPVGSTYRRSDGSSGTSFYRKESGTTTSAGWVPVGISNLTATPTTGTTVSFNDNSGDQIFYITPAGALADLTIDFPSDSTSITGQKVVFCVSQSISNLTLTGASTIFNAPVSMNAGDCFQFYKMASNVWARVIT